jgi:hypothetical protein
MSRGSSSTTSPRAILSSTNSPRAGSSSTTSSMLRVQVPRLIARLVVDYFAYAVRSGASAHRAARCAARRRLLRPRRASGRLSTSRGSLRGLSSTTSPRAGSSLTISRRLGSSSTTPPMPRVRVPQHVTRLVVNYFAYAAHPGASARRAVPRRLLRLRRASGCLGMSHGSSSTTSPTPRVWFLRHVARLVAWLVVDYFAYTTRPGASAHRVACRRLLRLTQARTPRDRVPRHIARLVTRLVVDYFAYTSRPGASARHAARRVARRRLLWLMQARTPHVRVPQHIARLVTRLVVDYFDYVARPGASASRAARHAARHRLLRLHRAFECLDTSRGSSCGSSSTTLPRAGSYTARLGASARRAARHTARHRLLRLCRASGCLGTVRGSSCRSLSTSTMPHVRVPRHVARLVTPLVVDYFAYATRPGASTYRAAHRRLLRLRRASGCLSTSRGLLSTSSPTSRVRVPRHIARLVIHHFASRRLVVDYFFYVVCPGASARHAARHAARHRLLRAPRLRLVATRALL